MRCGGFHSSSNPNEAEELIKESGQFSSDPSCRLTFQKRRPHVPPAVAVNGSRQRVSLSAEPRGVSTGERGERRLASSKRKPREWRDFSDASGGKRPRTSQTRQHHRGRCRSSCASGGRRSMLLTLAGPAPSSRPPSSVLHRPSSIVHPSASQPAARPLRSDYARGPGRS